MDNNMNTNNLNNNVNNNNMNNNNNVNANLNHQLQIKQQISALKSNSAMEKTPRYTQRERNMVLGFAAQYKDIIENKRTDAESNRKKDEVWRVIAKEFNERVYHQRTAKQLRQLYKNMKLLLKKDLSTDGRAENFIDILTALSQQPQMLQTFDCLSDPPSNKRIKYEENGKNPFHSPSTDNADGNDIVVIKSEELSDNDDQSYHHDDDLDSIDNNNIPEVCLEEEDDFDPVINSTQQCNGFGSNYNQQSNFNYSQQQQQQFQMQLQKNEQMRLQQKQLQQQQQRTLQQKQIQQQPQIQQQQQSSASQRQLKISHHLQNNTENLNESSNSSNNESLLSLAIEERKRKIELLNAQIEYWKTLTKKIEKTPICATNFPGMQQCSCHHVSSSTAPPAAITLTSNSPVQQPKVNGQS